ncbi:MAG TPA: biotin/lipoyl-containing protein, partial [Pyrinomonadaceae bacterium]
MATQVVMPKLSPTMEEGQLARWLKKEGDKVAMGEPLAEIDTDKATMEMQALSNGVLRKILINEGESAPLGQPIAIIGEADEDISALLKAAEATSAAPAKESQPVAQEAATATSKSSVSVKESEPFTQLSRDDGRQLISPIAARMAAEAGV